MNPSNTDKTAFLDFLNELSREQRSGIVFISVPPNHQARIGFSKGQIVHLAIHALRADAALQPLAEATPRSYRFEGGVTPSLQPGLPPTPEILKRLAGIAAEPAASAPPAEPVAAVEEVAAPALNVIQADNEAQAPRKPGNIDDETLAVVTEELTDFLGPIAADLVRERASAPSVGLLLNQLSVHFGNLHDAMRLRQRVERRLSPELLARRAPLIRANITRSAA